MNARRIVLLVLAILVAVLAIAGGIGLIAQPSGSIFGMDATLLASSPFTSFVLPGILLAIVVGGSMIVAAVALLRRLKSGASWSFVAGTILAGWIAVQVAMIGYASVLQPIFFVIGVVMMLLAELDARPLRRRAA